MIRKILYLLALAVFSHALISFVFFNVPVGTFTTVAALLITCLFFFTCFLATFIEGQYK